MKPNPPSPPFNSEEYIKSRLKLISKLSGCTFGSESPRRLTPTFNVQKIYSDYYQRALAGDLTSERLIKYEKNKARNLKPFDQLIPVELQDEWDGEPLENNTPEGFFNLAASLLPLVHQFTLFAAVSRVLTAQKHEDLAYLFTIKAAEAWGSIDKLRFELKFSNIVANQINFPLLVASSMKEKKMLSDKSNAGKEKGKIAAGLAKTYWRICVNNPRFKGLVKKYPKMGLTFSDELFTIIKNKKETEKFKKIPYTSRWFYTNVVVEFRPKDTKLTYLEKIQFSLKSVQNS